MKHIISIKNYIVRHRIILLTILICLLSMLFYALTAMSGVSGNSMYPTLKNGDMIFLERNNDCVRGDIVVINSDELGECIVKRVIGAAGDVVDIRQSGLYVNDELQKEDYLYEQDWCIRSAKVNVHVPEGYVFVMGDNRNSSFDSRDIGLVPIDCVFGKMRWDLSDMTGLSALGFKVVFGTLFLILCGVLCLKRPKLETVEVEEPMLEEPAEVAVETPVVVAEVTPVSSMSTFSDIPIGHYWEQGKNPVQEQTLRKE